MKDKPAYYAIIPADVRYNKNLPPNAKLLYGEITCLCDKKKYCWATNDYFARLYEVKKLAISRWVSLLEREGHIITTIKNNNMRRIFLDLNEAKKSLKKHKGAIEKSIGGLLKKHKGAIEKSIGLYNNTRDNNIKVSEVLRKPLYKIISTKNDFDTKIAKKLINIISSRMKRKPHLISIVKEIRNIRIRQEIPKDKIILVFKWYIKNYKNNFVSKIYKTKDISEKFKRIEDAYKRLSKDNPQEIKIKISKDVKKIASDLRDLGHWPNGCDKDLEQTIQLSLNNHKQYIIKHKKLLRYLKEKVDNKNESKTKHNKNKGILSFARHLKDIDILNIHWFVNHIWMYKIWNNLKNWDDFNGSLLSYVFTTDHKIFNGMGCNYADDYCADIKRWDSYKKLLNSING